METGLQLGSDLLQVGSQMMDLTWSKLDPSNKTVTISETVILSVYRVFLIGKYSIFSNISSLILIKQQCLHLLILTFN